MTSVSAVELAAGTPSDSTVLADILRLKIKFLCCCFCYAAHLLGGGITHCSVCPSGAFNSRVEGLEKFKFGL